MRSSFRIIPTLAAVVAKAFMAGCVEVRVEGLAAFVALLQDQERRRGILTFSNHLSSMDEPLMWAALPMQAFLDGNVRWTMGASDILFLSPVHDWFFKQGQVIETVRGGGIRQAAIGIAATKLDEGQHVHLFPEGKILCELDHDLHKFKWGVGQILMETRTTPHVVPMHIHGFDTLSTSSLVPGYLPPSQLSIKFGSPVNHLVEELLSDVTASRDVVRSGITDRLRESVVALGERQLERRFRLNRV